MKRAGKAKGQYRVSRKEALSLVLRYVRRKISEQLKAVAGIIIYLLLFQSLVLGIPILEAATIAIGMAMVVFGLTLFLEGLLIGIMPMGEEIGIRLPQKAGTLVILLIAFVLGLGATFAEPAIGVLKVAGSSVLAWQAPLLYLLLNRFAGYLVGAVGLGVGLALIIGMFRFLKGNSLKPYIYILVSLLLALSGYCSFHPNLRHLLGLAWDCGGVTTGPVTVPLVLALGIGISHVANRGGEKTEGGFGVVTLASLVPVIAVLSLGIILAPRLPAPMDEVSFFADNEIEYLFENHLEKKDYAIAKAGYAAQLAAFGGDREALMDYVAEIGHSEPRVREVFGSREALRNWLIQNGTEELKRDFQGLMVQNGKPQERKHNVIRGIDFSTFVRRNISNALRAIVPLSLFLLGVLYIIMRERLAKADEVFLGLLFAILGMAIFGGGIELGLAKIGDQVGSNLPVSFVGMENPAAEKIIRDFDPDIVNRAVKADGSSTEFFYYEEDGKVEAVSFQAQNYDETGRLYRYVPVRGPLFGRTPYSMVGILVVMIFAFIMGYSATLAEPALSALGLTVEDITVGSFKKSTLIQSVAIGVGSGIMLGVAKIIWNIPLFWLLGPLYLLLLVATWLSTEEFVNIGWDSAGVTTGPITVPLVLSMGLGIGSQVGVVEGFGILSMASVCPIISVLGMGLVVNLRRNAFLRDNEPENLEIGNEGVSL